MTIHHTRFAEALAAHLCEAETGLCLHPEAPHKVLAQSPEGPVGLDLTPFEATPQPATAALYFQSVQTLEELIDAYREARRSMPFEMDVSPLRAEVHPYAGEFLETLFNHAKNTFDDADARRIAQWVGQFDVYVAVKSVESLLNSQADLTLLKLSEEKGWEVHFDHLAIRCGSRLHQGCLQVVALLRNHHGYLPSQIKEEQSYQFPDGWDAYPLYKILENGQVLRLFLDESDGTDPRQIIQHWNRVYGFTAHHLAIRATQNLSKNRSERASAWGGRSAETGVYTPVNEDFEHRQPQDHVRAVGFGTGSKTDEGRMAISLDEVAAALAQRGIGIMTPTGECTQGLLVQVFTRPEWNPEVPPEIKEELSAIAPELETTIENGKLLELLSRREMPTALARDYFALYGLSYEPDNPLHSAPCYPYFLPAQAAHVIRTSVETRIRAS